ncbi:MAG: hypothetical protein V3V59_05775 [Thermodesulfovibrionales bacterium]
MRDNDINSEYYKDELEKILSTYEPSVELVFIEDILRKSSGSPFRIARVEENKKTGHKVIMIKSPFSRGDMASVTHRIRFCGIFSEVQMEPLEEDVGLFLRHTLLHEISEIRHQDNTECQHDQWAFDELEK